MAKHSSWIAMLAGIVLVAVAVAAPVSAHHGWSEYQDDTIRNHGHARDARQPCRPACHGPDESR